MRSGRITLALRLVELVSVFCRGELTKNKAVLLFHLRIDSFRLFGLLLRVITTTTKRGYASI